jgi:hypothetical protein
VTSVQSIMRVLGQIGGGTHPAEVTVTEDGRYIRLVIRPKHSSRTFILSARVDSAVEL